MQISYSQTLPVVFRRIRERFRNYLRSRNGRFDPVQQIYQWSAIVYFLGSLLIFMACTLNPLLNNNLFLQRLPAFKIFLVGFFILLVTGLLGLNIYLIIRYTLEQRWRNKLRRQALADQELTLAEKQPPTFAKSLSLQMYVDSRFRLRALLGALIGTACALGIVASSYQILNGNAQGLDLYLGYASYASLFFVPIIVGMLLIAPNPITAHYLHPSLQIDDEGIIARYGSNIIGMRWEEIRYFALIGSVTFGRKPAEKRVRLRLPRREVYEISDGRQIICWLVDAPVRTYLLRRAARTRLLPSDYDAFSSQLASLIMAKTGHSLYDFRTPRQILESELNG